MFSPHLKQKELFLILNGKRNDDTVYFTLLYYQHSVSNNNTGWVFFFFEFLEMDGKIKSDLISLSSAWYNNIKSYVWSLSNWRQFLQSNSNGHPELIFSVVGMRLVQHFSGCCLFL